MIYAIVLIIVGFVAGTIFGLHLEKKYRIFSYYLKDKNKPDNLNY